MSSSFEKRAFVAAYLILAVLLGIAPHDRGVWALENSVPFVEGLAAVLYYRWRSVELTRLAYGCVFLHLVIQMIGGHYTYAEVPFFDWLKEQFHWSRNHYDRLAHFAVGFCLYVPIREICLRRTPLSASRRWAGFFTLMTITAIAGMWEVWEWIVAEIASPDAGTAYLGMQGDPWDAQKDILMAPLGVVAAVLVFTARHNAVLDALARESSQKAPLDAH
jgi:putative membrane protein